MKQERAGRCPWASKEALVGKVTFRQGSEGSERVSHSDTAANLFQAEGKAGAKASGQEHASCVWGKQAVVAGMEKERKW